MNFFQELWESVRGFFINHWNAILTFLLTLIIGFILVKAIGRVFHRFMNRSRLKGAAGDFLSSLVKVLLYVIYLIALLALLGVPTTSMVALLSAFALAISLALQNTFSNVAAGVVIVCTKPFEEGDFVDIGGTSGVVETITIFNTKLVTTDNKVIILPNGSVSSANITNYNTKGTRRLDLIFSTAYGTDVATVKEIILGVIAKHQEIFTDPAPMVRLTEHGASSIDFVVRVWLKSSDYWPANFDLKEEVYAAFNEKGIEIPFPQMDVHVKQ